MIKINNDSADAGSKVVQILVTKGFGDRHIVEGMVNGMAMESNVTNDTSALISTIKVFEKMRGASDEKDKSGWDALQEKFQQQVDQQQKIMGLSRTLGNYHQGTRPYIIAALNRKMEIIEIAQSYANTTRQMRSERPTSQMKRERPTSPRKRERR